MAIENNAAFQFSRATRNAIRAACVNHAGFAQWAADNLTPQGKSTADIVNADLRACAIALGIDLEDIAERLGSTPSANMTADKPATATPATPTPEAMENAPPAAYEGQNAEQIIRDALAPANDMLGSKVLAMLHQTLAPLAAAAVAGPRVVTREVIRQVAIMGDTNGTVSRFVQLTGTKTARDVFGIKANEAGQWRKLLDAPLNCYDGTAAEGVPTIDPYHVWDVETLGYLSLAAGFADQGHRLRHLSRPLLYGPAGTGKTTGAQQFAARTGRPFIRVAFDKSTEPMELIGQPVPKNGSMVFRPGSLVAAMQVPYAVILLDEPSILNPGSAAVLQTILDTGCVFLKEDNNRRVDIAPGVIIMAADNTNLAGDETGRYAATQVQNIALQDRFAFMVRLDYLPEAREAKLLEQRTGIAADAALAMVSFAATTRKNAANGQLTAGCSLRRLIAWATACQAGVPSSQAFAAAILNATDITDRETVRALEKNCAPHGRIDTAVRGTPSPDNGTAPAPAGVTMTPQGERAAGVFGMPNVPPITP